MAFFKLLTARDMFEKLKREFQRLERDFSIDNVFNFFVAAYHLSDYARRTGSVPDQALRAFLDEPDLKDCRDLCDKGKHLRLSKRPDPKTVVWNGSLGGAPLNSLSLNGGVSARRSVRRRYYLKDIALIAMQRFRSLPRLAPNATLFLLAQLRGKSFLELRHG